MHLSSSVLLLGAQLFIPVTDHVPTLSVAVSCKGAASVAMADSQSYDACMKDENQAREQLLTSWQTFSVPHRSRCSAEASSEGIASYVELLVCLQIASGTDLTQGSQLKRSEKEKIAFDFLLPQFGRRYLKAAVVMLVSRS